MIADRVIIAIRTMASAIERDTGCRVSGVVELDSTAFDAINADLNDRIYGAGGALECDELRLTAGSGVVIRRRKRNSSG